MNPHDNTPKHPSENQLAKNPLGGGQHTASHTRFDWELDSSPSAPATTESTTPENPYRNSTCTTNRGSNSLYNQFKNAFSDANTKHLAFLMGYFRISGFLTLHNLILDSGGYERFNNERFNTDDPMREESSIRLLVGLNVDSVLFELSQSHADLARLSPENLKKFTHAFTIQQREYINKEEYNKHIEDSIALLRENMEKGNLEIRIVREKNAHAKFYLFYNTTADHTNPDKPLFQGSLIVGSSNLSHNGLENNYEFNIRTQNSENLGFAYYEFKTLWERAIPLEPSDIDSAKQNTYLERILSPKELYYKLLLSHFGEVFLHTDLSIEALIAKANYTPYEYQIHAVQQGIDKLAKYNGFFLSDVVGLGKTLIASVIAKKLQVDNALQGKILICAPNAVQKSWEKHFDDLAIHNRKITTHDSLHKLSQDERESFALVIVDESHNFRNTGNNKYEELQNLCKTPCNGERKKIMLVSATPQNNRPDDLANQIYLFRDKRDTTILESQSLESFFSHIKKEYDRLHKERKELNLQKNQEHAKIKRPLITERESKNQQALQKLSDSLRDRLLAKIMIRRTRADIESSYQIDKQKQGLKFPEILPPHDLTYDLDSISHNLATQTLLFLAGELNTIAKEYAGEKNGYTYARYLIYPNLTPSGKEKFLAAYAKDNGQAQDDRFYKNQSAQLAAFMQKILFKRFDSSIKAFKDTLRKQIDSYTQLIKQFGTQAIYLPKNYDNRERLYNLLNSEDDEALDDLFAQDKLLVLSPDDFEAGYEEKLEIDIANLRALFAEWEKITQDPKLQTLKDFLDSTTQEQKIVIFSEARSSSEYLAKKLESHYAGQILDVHSGNYDELESAIRQNFDANYPKDKQKDDKCIIITTDVLAEGVNLHRANIIINYDSPYNATQLMQRIGRINRVGTPHAKIHIYNFKPTHFNDHIININAIVSQKLQSFHYTLGEDSAIYDESEEFDSKKLFEKALSSQQKDLSKETIYQNDLKALFQNDKETFEHIKSLPAKCRSFIELDSIHSAQSFAYLRRDGDLRAPASAGEATPYAITTSQDILQEPTPEPCSVFDMADFLKKHIKLSPHKPADTSTHYSHIEAALTHYTKPTSPKTPESTKPLTSHLKADERKALAMLRSAKELDSSLRDSLIHAVEKGSHAKLAKEILAARSADALATLAQKYSLSTQATPNSSPSSNAESSQGSSAHSAPESSADSSDRAARHLKTKPRIELSITAFPKAKHHNKDSK